MEKIIVELEAKTDKAIKGIDKVAKSVENLNKDVVDSNKDTAKALKGVESASKSVSGGIKKIGASIKAAGLGLLIVAFGTIKELFSQNQKAVDLFNTAFEVTSIVVNQVINAFTDIYKAVSESRENFDALGKVLDGVLTMVLTPFKATFQGIKLALQSAQLAWEESFFGDKDPETIKRLNKEIALTKANLYEVADGFVEAGKSVYNNFGEAVTEAVNISKVAVKELGEVSVSAAIDTAKANVDLQKSAELAAARQGLLFEKFDRQAEKLRQIRDDETKSIEERKKANDELLVKIDSAEKGMLLQAQQQLAIADANLKKDKDNVEFQVARIEAIKELAAVEAQIEGIRSEQKSNALALDKEAIELINTKKESESQLSIEKRKFAAEQIESEKLRLEKLIEINEAEKIIEQERLQAIVDNANAGTQAKIDAEIALNEFTNTNQEENLTLKANLVQEEINLEAKKLAAKHKALNDLVGIFGAESKMGKAALIGKQLLAAQELLIDLGVIKSKATKAMATSSLDGAESAGAVSTGLAKTLKLGFPAAIPALIGYAATAVGIVSGVMAATKKTKSVATGLGGVGGGGSVTTPAMPKIETPQTESLPPAFNIVGASGTSQLADAIGGQSQQPQRAYVVSSDVTTSQEMERNTIEGASI